MTQGEQSPERKRLAESSDREVAWKMWGPYLSERQWGTVREDYSDNGDAWNYFTHDHARSRVYRWGEDGIAGFSDDKQLICFALALWNGKDPILKERLFGLTNAEGNHGEDVKECYFYLDSTPTHSYMKYLYKYPQAAFPYDDLVRTNRGRTRLEMEYELIDTGIFDDDRYFDVFVEYAKESPENILIRITAVNRGPDRATLHLLPTLWFRNTWHRTPYADPPVLTGLSGFRGIEAVSAQHPRLGERFLYCEEADSLLFTDNETNNARLFGTFNASRYVKDGINDFIISGNDGTVNPEKTGTKASALYRREIGAGEAMVVRLRLSDRSYHENAEDPFGASFDELFSLRLSEADEFYRSLTPPSLSDDVAQVLRQALAGMLWTKQYYYFDLDIWLEEHDANPLAGGRHPNIRNRQWFHMMNDDIISMPDKWEYPWYAAWDLAFHSIALNIVDPDFAREQLDLMLRDLYLHPSGQMPAYEWNFGDVNPPVHAFATLVNYFVDKERSGIGDINFLKSAFQKLLLNFTWWVNRKDPEGRNIFNGGFLGLDNIGVFDRSAPLPTGGRLEQADGTAWMAIFCQNMFEIALELAVHEPFYEDMALKFLEHFLIIAGAMDRVGIHGDELWDEEDGFYYDVLRMPDGTAHRIKVRSMVGLLPLCATTVVSADIADRFPRLAGRVKHFVTRHPELTANIAKLGRKGVKDRRLIAVLNEEKLRRVLARMLDEDKFLSRYGIRSLSRHHLDNPYAFDVHGQRYEVRYLPAESDTGMFGGNSNWRGPIWFPVNILILRALMQFYSFYGDDFRVECPTGSGRMMTLFEVTREITTRLVSIFVRNESGKRAVYGGTAKFQNDPHWRDHILFYEYFHGDNGAGLGASHQTGWTGTVARLIQMLGSLDAKTVLEGGFRPGTGMFRR